MNVDDSTPTGKMLLQMVSGFAEMERNLISERTSSVMQSMSRNNELRTKPPFGWKIENKEMVEDSYEQQVIELIRTLKQEDPKMTVSEICRYLASKNIKIRKSKKPHFQTIKNIMINNGIIDTTK
jgi:DNA invertase Pin-like site-specific DNA recombinase